MEQETYPSERNISYDRKIAVDSHNELLQQYDALPEDDKSWRNRDGKMSMTDDAMRMSSETNRLRREVGDIDKYREMAKPIEGATQIHIDQNPDTLRQEKDRIDKEVERTKKSIQNTTAQLNDLRTKLGLGETDDIPSLTQAKEKLTRLLLAQENLSSQVSFEDKKIEAVRIETTENANRENKNILTGFENVANDLRRLAARFEERKSKQFNSLFQDEEQLGVVAHNIGTAERDEIRKYLQKITEIFTTPARHNGGGINDNQESLYELSSMLRILSSDISEISSKVSDDENRKELSKSIESIKDAIDRATSYVVNKANALQR